AYDEAGNSAFQFIIITKDTITPFVNITSPGSGLFTESTSITLNWEQYDNIGGTDIDYSEVTVNGVSAYSGSATTQLIDLIDDGIKNIIVTTYDYAGNTATDHIVVIVDTTNPFVEILSPINNYNTSLDDLTIYWRASDNETGIDTYEVYLNGSLIHTITNAGITSADLTFTLNGTYIIDVKAIDYLGHEYQDSINVTYNSTFPTLDITSPVEPYYYSAATNITIDWDFANIENITQFEIYVDGNLNATLSNTTKSYELVFGTIPIDSFPEYNVTVILRTTNSSIFYSDLIWIAIDQAAPTVSIINPLNNTIIDNQVICLEWLSADTGSSILKTIVKVDGLIVDVWDYTKNNQYLNLEGMYGQTPISIDIIDIAGNFGTDTIYLDLFLVLPEFTVDLPTPYYSQTEDFNFDINVNDPRAGVMIINVYIDTNRVEQMDYTGDIQNTTFTLQMNVTGLLYVTLPVHSLEIVIIDSFSRETSYTNTFYIDDEAPQIFSPTLGTQALSGDDITVERDQSNGNLILYLNVTITDSHQISTITVRFYGNGFDQTLPMIPESGNTDTLGQYYLALDFTNLTLGDYTITITVTDTAGNIEAQNYGISLTSFVPVPWILQGNNLIYVSAGSGLVVLLTIILSVALRRTFTNMGWKKDIVAVAYIFNGMPCVYMVNSPDLVQDELLFGGAMTGIRGVLEEITGEKSKLEIQTVEMGQKNVLICPGNYGDAVLMVNKIRPIYREKIISFTKNFEKSYQHILKSDEIFIMERYSGAQVLVQEHFGVHDEMQLIDDCSYDDIKLTDEERDYYQQQTKLKEEQQLLEKQQYEQAQPYEPQVQDDSMAEAADAFVIDEPKPQTQPAEVIDEKVAAETAFIEEILQKVTPEQRTLFIDIIQNSQKALTELLERNFEEANVINTQIIVNLEKLLASDDITNEANNLLKTILILSTEFHAAIDHAEKGEEAALQRAVEKASRIWLNDIGEKW
ncbi:MAG: Ig-like domain-containing protein, partial [Candidatus Heimdallarchaeota archaeon]